jgi:hypothetical protein
MLPEKLFPEGLPRYVRFCVDYVGITYFLFITDYV